MMYKNGSWYDANGNRMYPNKRQIEALQAAIDNKDGVMSTPVEDSVVDAPLSPQTKRTWSRKKKVE